jgi:hypothetical protein
MMLVNISLNCGEAPQGEGGGMFFNATFNNMSVFFYGGG